MTNSKINKFQFKTKVIIAFVLLFICRLSYSQNICRDTNCVEFANAKEEWDSIPKKFTGYIKIRHKIFQKPGKIITFDKYKEEKESA
ncbi:MAG: hypothetical protein IPG89_03630 [Bacteroidetes bacterium]|nr:hypothetical protein [Bacteroidota bacterium]